MADLIAPPASARRPASAYKRAASPRSPAYLTQFRRSGTPLAGQVGIEGRRSPLRPGGVSGPLARARSLISASAVKGGGMCTSPAPDCPAGELCSDTGADRPRTSSASVATSCLSEQGQRETLTDQRGGGQDCAAVRPQSIGATADASGDVDRHGQFAAPGRVCRPSSKANSSTTNGFPALSAVNLSTAPNWVRPPGSRSSLLRASRWIWSRVRGAGSSTVACPVAAR